MSTIARFSRPSLAWAALALLPLVLPASARADGERVLFSAEASYVVPTDPIATRPFAPGGGVSLAAHFSLTQWLMPLARARGALLGAGDRTLGQGELGSLGSVLLGIRFRPRGIAHPEEPSRAGCVWGEIDAGLALWNGRPLPTFEAAVGFLFLAGDVDVGPAFRFVHLWPTAAADGPETFLVTVGLELLFGDAR
ncbi:MAG: hypothetical protein U0234_28725 [Sandaracinus sp.]